MITIDSVRHLEENSTIKPTTGKWFISVVVSIEFILDLPQIEQRTYYNKNMSQGMKDRLNMLGNRILIYYDAQTQEVTEIVVNIAHLVMITYQAQNEIQKIIKMLEVRND